MALEDIRGEILRVAEDLKKLSAENAYNDMHGINKETLISDAIECAAFLVPLLRRPQDSDFVYELAKRVFIALQLNEQDYATACVDLADKLAFMAVTFKDLSTK
jgi:hypothetical protein